MSEIEKEPTKNVHLSSIFHPVLISIEEQVNKVQLSQSRLSSQLEILSASLNKLKGTIEDDQLTTALEERIKKLNSLKRRLTLVHTILQNSNERCRRLLSNCKIPG